jgi:hypothetical protein
MYYAELDRLCMRIVAIEKAILRARNADKSASLWARRAWLVACYASLLAEIIKK